MKLLSSLLFLILTALGFAAGEVSWKVLRLEGEAPTVTAVVEATIQPGWHLYSTIKVPDGPFETTFKVGEEPITAKVGEEGLETKYDKGFLKDIQLFENKGTFWVPLPAGKAPETLDFKVRFQVCKDGVCIPPADVPLSLKGVSASETVTEPKVSKVAKTEPTKPVSTEASEIEAAKKAGVVPFILLAIGAGLTALLTPCVFPMIPITVSFFSKQKQGGLKQPLLFCGGIIGTFTGLGIIVSAIFGATGLNQVATNPWVNLGIAIVFIVLALSLFGVFEIGLPSKFVNKFDASGKSGWIAPVFMGLTFSLTSFTCTLPFVGTLLASASSGGAFWPILGMLVFSTTFAIPFFLLALFPSALAKLPRSGAWMVVIKAYMGFIELMASIKFLSNFDVALRLGFLTREVIIALWFMLLFGAGLYCLGAIKLPKVDDGKIGPFRTAVGVLSILGSLKILIALGGASLGSLEGMLPPTPYPGKEKMADKSGWTRLFVDDWDTAKAKAKETGKPIFIDFTGLFCPNCRVVERNVFTDEQVQKTLGSFVPVSLYTDRDDPAHKESDKRNQQLEQSLLKTTTLPTYAVVSPDGTLVKGSWAFIDDPKEFDRRLQETLK